MPTKLRRRPETEKGGRQLHVINGLVHYQVSYSQGGIGIHITKGLLGQFMGEGSGCLETGLCIPNSRFMNG